MKNHPARYLVNFGLVLLLGASKIQAQYNSALEGQKTGSFYIGDCNVESIHAKYKISTSLGEPTVYVNIKWRHGSRSSIDCLQEKSFNVFIKVYARYDGSEYFITADGAIGTIPKGDEEWGYNPISGSPNYNRLLTKGSPSLNPNTNDFNFVPEETAKRIWKAGFTVNSIVFKEKGGIQMYFISR